MKRTAILILSLIFPCLAALGQTFTGSNLPIVIIETDGGANIPDEPGILADMKIIFRGEGKRNYLTDRDSVQYLNYNGRIDIEMRGSSTQVLPKKQYGFTTLKPDNSSVNNVKLLGMPPENDWILNGMAFDPLRIRDYLCYNLSRKTGEYASRTVYCELMINGSYIGLYLLQEKIKADDDRVNVIKIAKADKYLPDLTGGYITKSDKTTGGDPVAWTMPGYVSNADAMFIHELPKPENVTAEQNAYIKNEFLKLDALAFSGNASYETGYPTVIDIPSFAHYMIINELSSNADAYQFSTYYHKDRNGKLRAGPVWDNDLTFGNDIFMWGLNRSHTNVWQFANGDNEGPYFWRFLFRSNEFRCYVLRRWLELTSQGGPLGYSAIEAYIDQTVSHIGEAVARDRARWSVTGDFTSGLVNLKAWLFQRIAWINNNLGTLAGCPDPVTPQVTITKINYSPVATFDFPDPQDLEFIEIRNTGTNITSLSGAYFPGTGFVYQFPAYTMIKPGAVKILANDEYAFRMVYGFNPAGVFTRNLSNDGEKLILADAFGYIIDYVDYSDKAPWPDADSNGYYLELANPLADNNDPTNWIANKNSVVSTDIMEEEINITITPNPAWGRINITSAGEINKIQIISLQGKVLFDISPAGNSFEADISSLHAGIYIVKAWTPGGSMVRKLVKR